jgi:anti-sigma B factor antagonist
MFSITLGKSGDVWLSGRFDASRVDEAYAILDTLSQTTIIDMRELDYISSAGLGALLKTQKRLKDGGNALVLVNMNKLIRDIFRIARLDLVFTIKE